MTSRTLRNALGIMADVAIGVFGLLLLARGMLFAAALPLVVAAVDLASRLGLLPFARRGALTGRQRGDLLWGVVLALVGTGILLEEFVVVANGARGGWHVAAVVVGAGALAGSLAFFGRLVRARR
jgi:hypothetical protein